MLRRPGHLEQPAAQPRRLANEGGVQQGVDRSGSGQHDRDESRRHLAAEPRGEADHRQKEAKAVNQVSAASASQPLTPVRTATTAALKCQR